jgi:hypothetical protein
MAKSPSNTDIQAHPMRSIVDSWLGKIEIGLKERHERFGKYAEEATRFYDGNHDWMWQDHYARGNGGFLDKEGGVLPNFRISVNKLFEAVALFGPALYHQNPNILVNPLEPPEVPPEAIGIDPNDPYAMAEYQQLAAEEQQHSAVKRACASVKTRYLNWLQQENDKKTQARRAITEAIVAGVGYLETTVWRPPSDKVTMPTSRYLSWYDVVLDPDAVYWEDLQYIAIRRVQPTNLAERRFNLEPGSLKGHFQSFATQASKRGKKEAKENRAGKSFDLVEYWEVFSKNGFGDRLKSADNATQKNHQFDYEVLGDNCWIVVCKGIPYPLNCPTTTLMEGDGRQVFDSVQWPIPFWYDQDGWPISRLTFYEKPAEVWPISLFKPAIGELRFINWCLSFLADKVASSCVTYMGVLKEAGATIQKQLTGSMTPFTVVEISTALGKPLSQVVEFLQAPNFSADIWKMISEVLDLIDKRTGLTELIYGLTGTQMRSATEANVRDQNISVRPDDMASRTEDFLSEVAIREMQAARWFVEPQDVEPSIGKLGAMVWANYVMQGDPADVVMNFEYRIEAGSAKKPNKNNKISQLQELSQYALPIFQNFATQGIVSPYNGFMTELCKAMDIEPGPFIITPDEMQQGGDPAAQQQMQAKMQEMDMKLQEMGQKLQHEHDSHHQQLEHDQQKHEQDLKITKEQNELKAKAMQAQASAAKAKKGAA